MVSDKWVYWPLKPPTPDVVEARDGVRRGHVPTSAAGRAAAKRLATNNERIFGGLTLVLVAAGTGLGIDTGITAQDPVWPSVIQAVTGPLVSATFCWTIWSKARRYLRIAATEEATSLKAVAAETP